MGFFMRGVQFGGDGAMLVNPNTPNSTDTFNAPFRCDPNGMVYVDYTNSPGASSETANGWAFSSSGQLFCTTAAITGASTIKQGVAVTATGQVHITFVEPSPSFQIGPFTASATGVVYVAGPIETQAAWFQWKQGITSSDGFVSQWNDKSGNSRNLFQPTATHQPSLVSDLSILFDGVDNLMQTAAFALAQPFTLFLLMKQVTWTLNDRIADGADGSAGVMLYQSATTPEINLNLGTGIVLTTFTVDSYAVLCGVANGASSVIQRNLGTPVTGDAGVGGIARLTLGAAGDGTSPSNIQVKEGILYASALDATQRARVVNYLSALGNLGL